MIYKPAKKDIKNGSLSSHKELRAFLESATTEDILIIRKASDALLNANGWIDLIEALEAKQIDLQVEGLRLSVDKCYFKGFMAALEATAQKRTAKTKGNYKGAPKKWEENLEIVRKYYSLNYNPTRIAAATNLSRNTVYKCLNHIKEHEDQLGLNL